jgi:uridine kinase
MKRLTRHHLFVTGFCIRILLLAMVLPYAVQHWYAPFLANSIVDFSLDPWAAHLTAGGDPLAYPYGYAMWLVFLPLTSGAVLWEMPVTAAHGLSLLCADISLLWVLRRLTDTTDTKLLALYWMSPIVIFATYWLGLNDLLPVLLLTMGLVALRDMSPSWAAVFVSLAISAKLSMILAMPFLMIYLFHNKRLRLYLFKFVIVLTMMLVLLQALFLLSPSGRLMLFGNPELNKVYDISLPFGNGLQLYMLPLVYLLALFGAWRVRRMSFDLLMALLGIIFLLVLLLTPASPGWFMWVLPFLVLYQVKSDRVAIALVSTFSFLYIGLNGLLAPLPSIPVTGWLGGIRVADWLALSIRTLSLWQTFLLATGLILAARMLREGIQINEYFRLSRKPFALGIAGDSGAGKDTLANALEGIFGSHSVVQVSGDNYHLWDRHKPMWQVMTHLNPRANDLARFAEDIHALVDGRSIQSRHYNHVNGKMSKLQTVISNDFVFVSGLHALYLPSLRELYDLKIYLDMDDGLRSHLKVNRDVSQRDQQREKVLFDIGRRQPDSERFIRPQAGYADLVLALQPIHPDTLVDVESVTQLRLKLNVRARQGLYYEDLVRVLIGVCGLHVDIVQENADSGVELTIEGDTDRDDIALAARELLPQLNELLDIEPAWLDGMPGLMQLIVLTHIAQALRSRLL